MNKILEYFSELDLMTAEGFDDAILGLDYSTNRVIYSLSRCREILMNQGISYDEAIEYLDFNVVNSYLGEKTPIWCEDDL